MRGKQRPWHPAGERALFLRPRRPLSTAKGERERPLSSASARSDRRDEHRHAGDEQHPPAGDSLTAPALPAPALGGGSRAVRCQSRAGKLDLNWEKQKTSSQRRCRINRVLK